VTAPVRFTSRYGVTLSRLREEDLELVRAWRNDPDIAQFMQMREHITPEMQRAWFERVDTDDNYFFVVEHQGVKVGLADAKNISWTERCCEGGGFYRRDYWSTIVPYQGTFTCFDFVFDELRLDSVRSRVLATNHRAIRYNLALGYVLQTGQDGVENQWYTVTREAYERKTAALRRTVERAVNQGR
jgi:hypothetical protein